MVEIDGTRILLDPWLLGPAIVGHPVVHRARLVAPAVPPEDVPPVDALVISHPFPDHCNRTTLRKLSRDLPAFTPTVAWPFVKALGRFRKVTALGNCAGRGHPVSAGRVSVAWFRAAAVLDTTHNALVLRGREGGATLVYAPHGLPVAGPATDALERYLAGRLDALLCTFSLVDLPAHLGGVANLGVDAAIALIERLRPRFVVPTHDGDKPDTGFIARATRTTRCRDVVAAVARRVPAAVVVLPVTGQPWWAPA